LARRALAGLPDGDRRAVQKGSLGGTDPVPAGRRRRRGVAGRRQRGDRRRLDFLDQLEPDGVGEIAVVVGDDDEGADATDHREPVIFVERRVLVENREPVDRDARRDRARRRGDDVTAHIVAAVARDVDHLARRRDAPEHDDRKIDGVADRRAALVNQARRSVDPGGDQLGGRRAVHLGPVERRNLGVGARPLDQRDRDAIGRRGGDGVVYARVTEGLGQAAHLKIELVGADARRRIDGEHDREIDPFDGADRGRGR